MKTIIKSSLRKMGILLLTVNFYRSMKTVPGRSYNCLFRLFRFHKLLEKINPSFQIKLLPKDTRGIIDTLIYVNPKDIKWGGRPVDLLKGGFILKGEWDLADKKHIDDYMDSYIYCRTVKDIFVKKKAFHESEQYKEMKDLIEQKEIENWRSRGCKNIAEIDEYFMGLYRIFDNIQKHGYKSQKELGNLNERDEIHIFINRNGELTKTHGNGHHRLAMVKILDIDQIPVVVEGVHYDWAEYCYKKYNNSLISALNKGIKNDIAAH